MCLFNLVEVMVAGASGKAAIYTFNALCCYECNDWISIFLNRFQYETVMCSEYFFLFNFFSHNGFMRHVIHIQKTRN